MTSQKSVRRSASRSPASHPSSSRGKASGKPPGTPPSADAARFSRTEWLADILRERILNGTYAPGERIREIQLRNEFGFSNGPIREALQAIVAEGLAERAPWHGVSIKQLDEGQLLELFQLRLALLEYAAELAARNRSEDALDKAAVLKKEMDAGFSEIDRGGQHPSFNGKLSQWLLTTAGNRMMREVWDKTMHQTLIYVNASLLLSHGRKSRALIHALIDTICKGDVMAARQAARDLTQQTLVDLGIKGTL
ncbi:MAG: GntR family transcriptional regulator [Pseudolabrys sp.]|nr:GntR family transcriptional regulator [Pseudolabrys sp.]